MKKEREECKQLGEEAVAKTSADTHQVTHQVEASPKGGLAQPPKINSQNMTVHDPSVCVASVVFQVHS